jgi:epsilon-lactone hydrolase
MPSEQFKKYMQENPGGMPTPEMFSADGELKLPVMPEEFKMTVPEVPAEYSCEEVNINGIKGLRVSSSDVKSGQAYFHIHPGGFTMGTAAATVPLMVHIVKTLQIDCYSIEYSLAPKHKFPVQVNECLAFYRGLLDKGYKKIIISGESAGGNLSIAVTHYIKDEKLPLPAAVVALSPIGDLSYYKREVYKPDFFIEIGPLIKEAYAPDADAENPYHSPVYGDFTNFPPLLLQAGGAESLAAESVRLAEAAARDDAEVLLHVWKDMRHAFAAHFGNYPEADAAMLEITNFVMDKLEL